MVRSPASSPTATSSCAPWPRVATPSPHPSRDICTTGIQAIEPDASVDDALRMMREEDIRRLPVVKNGRPVGIISLGDLAVEREPDSTLADISAAAPDQ